MVGHRFVEAAIERGLTETYDIVVVGEEPRPAYDRVALTSFFEVGRRGALAPARRAVRRPAGHAALDTAVVAISTATPQIVTLADGEDLHYDELVLATGAAPFVPPVPGHDLAGCFVYRTIEDLEAIRDARRRRRTARRGHRRRPARARGGQRPAPARPRDPRRRDRAAADAGAGRRRRRPDARRHIEKLGLTVHTGALTEAVLGDETGRVDRLALQGRATRSRSTSWSSRPASGRATSWPAPPASTSPSAAASSSTSTAAPPTQHIWAIGECAALGGPDVRPGRARLRDGRGRRRPRCSAGRGEFTGADMSTKLKLLGVDVASLRRRARPRPRARSSWSTPTPSPASTRSWSSPTTASGCSAASWSATRRRTRAAADGRQRHRAAGQPRGADPPGRAAAASRSALPDDAQVCSCNDVTKARDHGAVSDESTRRCCADAAVRQGLHHAPARPAARACRSVKKIVEDHFAAAGKVVDQGLCEHFRSPGRSCSTSSRSTATRGSTTSSRPTARGRGCDICKPAVASILASLLNGHVLDGEPRAAGHQRRLPRQHPAQRHLLGRAAHPRRRDHAGEADRDRRGRPRLRPLHEDHRRPADRPVRRPDGAAAGDLAAAGRRRLRVRPRLRQGAAHREVLRRLDLVPLRRAGLGRAGDRPGAALPRAALAAQAQGRRLRLRPRVRRGAARTSASSPPRRAGTSTSAATAAPSRRTPSCSPATSTPRR